MNRTRRFLSVLLASLPAAALTAQSRTGVVPRLPASGVANSATSYPWNRASASMRVQYFYNPVEFDGFAITIKEIRFRNGDADQTSVTWNGGTYDATLDMSTSPVAASAVSSSFAANEGADKTRVYAGPVVLSSGSGTGAGVPSNNYITITLTTPFKYDPSKGPLNVDFALDGSNFVGSPLGAPFVRASAAVNSTTRDFVRVFNTSDHLAANGTVGKDYCLVMEMDYDFDATIVEFDADARAGITGLTVNYTDHSFTSGVGGILGWSWDLDGDSQLGDSTLANPTWTYNTPGEFDITLQVVVAQGNGSATLTKKGYVVVADPVLDRTVPDVFQFQFNELRGDRVANTAVGSPAPAEGVMSNTGWQGDPNRNRFNPNEAGFGCMEESGLPNDNWIDTQWPLSLQGSTTIMWWHRLGNSTTGERLSYVCGGDGGNFRMWTRDRGRIGIDGVNSGLGRFEIEGTKSFIANTWAHCALVIDDSVGEAHWYVNGEKFASQTFAQGTFGASNTGFRVGKHQDVRSVAQYYQMDDFRIYGSALTHRQVIAASANEGATASAYGTSCDGPGGTPIIGSTGGAPTTGNSSFAITLANGEANQAVLVVVGFAADVGGTFPFDLSGFLSSGCWLETFPDLMFLGAISAAGTFTQPLPIPPDHVGLPGFHAYAQAMFKGSTTGAATRGLDINIQR